MKKAALIAMFLLVAAVFAIPAPSALAGTNCAASYQACRNGCGGNATCLGNCWDNACRGY